MENEGVQTRSQRKKAQHDKDVVSLYVDKVENEWIDTLIQNIMVVEIPVKEHGRPEYIEVKETELQNLITFDTFEEAKDIGQKTIQSRWVLMEKQAHDGQKRKIKGRLVAKGFQEKF